VNTAPEHRTWIYIALGVLSLVAAGGYAYAWREHSNVLATRAESDAALKSVTELQEKLSSVTEERDRLQQLLQQASDENAAFGKRVEELASSVSFLDKLSKTDRELLQKYSSVYFLSENFIPDPLVPIDSDLLTRPNSNAMIHGNIVRFLRAMMQSAKADGAPLLILSAYRSFGEQSAVKTGYKVTYGAGTANKFSADQGYSEHQLGSTVDFVTPENPDSLKTSFSTTEQYTWLTRNAYKYGFVLSYPEGNSFFQFEPWHWRFVGIDLATRLYQENKQFYDLDQREINMYLARIFD
jgi:LAS superfamily LD-carboxypeptidase LdcB